MPEIRDELTGFFLPPLDGTNLPLPIFNFNNAIIVYYSPQNTTY